MARHYPVYTTTPCRAGSGCHFCDLQRTRQGQS